MQKTTLIYFVLAAFFSLGIVVDWVVWQGVPPSWTWNDVTQMIGIITLCLYWESIDSQRIGARHRGSAKLLTILLPPLGTTVYFFQSRHWPQALGGSLLFWAGLIAPALVADEICYRLLG